MKQGDAVSVQISGINVGNAVVESVKDNQVTLVIPAQRVVMGMRVQLEDTAPSNRDTTGTETVIEGVDRSAPVEPQAVQVEQKPVVGNVEPQVQAPAPLPMAEDNTPEAIEEDSAAGKTAREVATREPIKEPVTITGVDGHSYRLPPGTTMEDLMEPAANE